MTDSNNNVAKKVGDTRAAFFKSFFSFLITFVFMFLSWIVLSGKFDPLLLWLGGISSFFVAYYFYDLLFPAMEPGYGKVFFRFISYVPWLIWEIIKANFHLLYLAFHPQMKDLIDPHIITFKTNLKSDIAITTLANSITLTPGTITVTADSDGVFRVHAIDRESADALPGTMLKKVAKVFGEKI
ncbi:MAG: Na+/H+ antiporter subunit E [Desulfobacterales bacterium]|nr:Na+/H+ antiporter subunit E [Desulfobacterales bacterium]MBU8910879.1 Na+/H+ antiporter subunit E [Desulfobacterales bacterium]